MKCSRIVFVDACINQEVSIIETAAEFGLARAERHRPGLQTRPAPLVPWRLHSSCRPRRMRMSEPCQRGLRLYSGTAKASLRQDFALWDVQDPRISALGFKPRACKPTRVAPMPARFR